MKFHTKAFLLGALVDLGLSLAVGPLLIATKLPYGSTGFYAGSLILGVTALIVAGYVVAKNSSDAKIANALILGAVMLLLSIVTLILMPSMPLWFVIPSLVLTPPAAFLGAYIERRI